MDLRKLISILGTLICLALSAMVVFIASVIRNTPLSDSQPSELPSRVSESTQASHAFLDTYMLPSETPTPLDYGALPVTQTAVALESTSAASEATLAASESTQNAVERINAGATATAKIVATNTAIAAATNVELARQTQNQIALDEAEQQRVLEKKKAQDKLEIVFVWTWKIGGSIIAILVICLWITSYFYKKTLRAIRKPQEAISDDFLANICPTTVQVSTDPLSGFQHHLALTSAEVATLRRAVTDLKGRLSRRTIVRGEYFTETRWKQIYDELLHQDVDGISMFERNTSGGISPTEAGWKWLDLTPPTPPQVGESSENLQTKDNHHATPLRPIPPHPGKLE